MLLTEPRLCRLQREIPGRWLYRREAQPGPESPLLIRALSHHSQGHVAGTRRWCQDPRRRESESREGGKGGTKEGVLMFLEKCEFRPLSVPCGTCVPHPLQKYILKIILR